MQIHDVKKPKNKKAKKRVARGGKRGTYAGRGIKGQKARAGSKRPSPVAETIQRLPKLKGIKFSSIQPETKIVKVGDLEKTFQTDVITKDSFIEKGIIKKKSEPVKILGDGKVNKAYEIKVPASKSAKEKIEKAGGKVLT